MKKTIFLAVIILNGFLETRGQITPVFESYPSPYKFEVQHQPQNVGLLGGDADTLGQDLYATHTSWIWRLGDYFMNGTYEQLFVSGGQDAVNQHHAFAEGYVNDTPYLVEGAVFYAGRKDVVSGTNREIAVALHLVEDDQSVSTPHLGIDFDSPGPGPELASKSMLLEDVRTSLTTQPSTVVMFDNPVYVDEDFAVSVNIEEIYTVEPLDTFTLMATDEHEGDGIYTWHKNYAGYVGQPGITYWMNTDMVFGTQGQPDFDINLPIFPIVQETVGIEDLGFFDGMKMNIYPNPAIAEQSIFVEFELESATDEVIITIISGDGKTIAQFNEEGTLGPHRLRLDDLPRNGTYICCIMAGGRKMAKRVSLID